MKENQAKVSASAVKSSAGARLSTDNDGDTDKAAQWAMEVLDARRGRQDAYAPDDTSDSDDGVHPLRYVIMLSWPAVVA